MKTIRILGKDKRILPIESIVLLEAKINYTCIHLDDGSRFLSSFHLGSYQQKLPDFLRINKSFLVNQSFVKAIAEGAVVQLKNGVLVEPSRRRKAFILNKLNSLLN
ncbi:MAG: LytTR family transcriptional regulator DNA-binding domain-containing protein [Spirosomataceae bacterium]